MNGGNRGALVVTGALQGGWEEGLRSGPAQHNKGEFNYPGPPPPLTWPPPDLKETDLPFLLGGLAIALVERVVLLVVTALLEGSAARSCALGAMIAGARFCLGVGVWTRVWPSRDRRMRPNLRFLLDTGLGIPGDQHACLLAETAARSIPAVLGRVGPPVWCDLERTSSTLVSALGGSTDGFETKAMDVSAASQDATDDVHTLANRSGGRSLALID
ncbi:hypothetical protein EDB85DRAFT_1890514 [Lactarius pseudohatsudake]|nr:hypothetical protein EDB85DRAFT_1890514 [Lactarius pseudohatsudake]